MLIFVMMLVSTGLMYYYFQRTRALQRQVVALQTGEGGKENSSGGVLDFLNPAARPAAAPIAGAAQSGNPAPAASTPTPSPVVAEAPVNPPPPGDVETTESLSPVAESSLAAETPIAESEPAASDGNPAQETDSTQDQQALNSMYDAKPAVRVRKPNTNTR